MPWSGGGVQEVVLQEIADVFLYLIRLSHKARLWQFVLHETSETRAGNNEVRSRQCHVDLPAAALDKLAVNDACRH